jgi:hypothetical protein
VNHQTQYPLEPQSVAPSMTCGNPILTTAASSVFLLIAARNPSAHRSLIAFAAWSSLAHAVAMSILGLEIPSQRVGFLVGSAVLVVVGVALIVLAPAKQSVERLSV